MENGQVPDLKNNEKAKKLDFPKNRGGKGGLFERKSQKAGFPEKPRRKRWVIRAGKKKKRKKN